MTFLRSLTLFAFLFVAGAAAANTPLEKCGEAKLTVLFWDIYESSLYTPEGRYTPGIRPLRLEIKYLRDIKAQDLIEQTAKEWRAQGLDDPRHVQWLADLAALWPDVSGNDVITLTIDEASHAHFSFNGRSVGSIEEPDFARDFSGIWLSPLTTRPKIRAALIGSDTNA